MTREFNTTGSCNPQDHYMVDLTSRLDQIQEYVEDGNYFLINLPQQYGKTTALKALEQFLRDTYVVIPMDFLAISFSEFETEHSFSLAFLECLQDIVENSNDPISGLDNNIIDEAIERARSEDSFALDDMFPVLSKVCYKAEKPVVLIIDEVDNAPRNQVFLDFLTQLRGYYLHRNIFPTFQSVILACVNDIRYIKFTFSTLQHKNYIPWNIAADFNIDMSFNVKDIKGMLKEYEEDHHTGMNIPEISQMIYDSTSGYPFLVSRLCWIIDTTLSKKWDVQGFIEAEKILIHEDNSLFQSLSDKVESYPELKEKLKAILFNGNTYGFMIDNPVTSMAFMYGFIKNDNGTMMIANRIFETRLYNFFIDEVENSNVYKVAADNRRQYIENGLLNMKLVLERFVDTFTDLYEDKDPKFIEEVGRKYFLLFLKPIINGTGHYYVEARTRSSRRTDIIVDYNGKQYIIELKIWRGDQYHEDGEKQISEYLDYYKADTGYMLVFNFNKNKEVGIKEIHVNGKTIIEATV